MVDAHLVIAAFHVLLVAPFFLYVAFQRAATPNWVYTLMIVLGAVVGLYHAFKAVRKWAAGSPSLWVNVIHVLVVAPLLLFIGVNGKKTGRPAYEILAMVGFAALGYHLYNLAQMAQVIQTD